MVQHLEKEIEKLKSSLLQVGTLVEEAVRDSVRSFSEKDLDLAELIIENDRKNRSIGS